MQEVDFKFDVDTHKLVTPVIRRILCSMKENEYSASEVKLDFINKTDKE